MTPSKRIVCPLSGHVVTAIPRDDWVENKPYRCHRCGSLTTYRIRGTDYAGQARLHKHYAPEGWDDPKSEEAGS